MSERRGILAAGNFIRDRVKIIDTYPAQDCLANILVESVCNGGGPYNVLVDLALLEAPFPLFAAGCVGADGEGRAVLDDLQSRGIHTDRLYVLDDVPTSYTDVMTVKDTGRRTFFHQRGANALLGPDMIQVEKSSAKVFYLGYLLLLDSLDAVDEEYGTGAARVLAQAGQAGLITVVDAVSEESRRYASVVQPALRYADYCLLNEIEAERTIGKTVLADEASQREACERLLDCAVRRAAVVHSPKGAACVARDGSFHWQPAIPIPVDRIVGTVGAGDAFAAGFLYALHENMDLGSCLRHGACAAAVSLTDASPSLGLRDLELVLSQCRAWTA